jgi:hypothetical protein
MIDEPAKTRNVTLSGARSGKKIDACSSLVMQAS